MRLLLSTLLLAPLALAADLAVPAPFLTIQDAVDAAQAGDVVVVSKGTYFENVVITTSGISIEGKGAIIDGSFAGPCITVMADNVSIDGLSLTNAGDVADVADGISYFGDGAIISNVALHSGAGIGIRVDGANARIEDCDVSACILAGIRVFTDDTSSLTFIEKNNVDACGRGIASTGGAVRMIQNRIEAIAGAGIEATTDSSGSGTQLRSNRLARIRADGIVVMDTGSASVELLQNRLDVVNGVGILVESTDGAVDIDKSRVTGAINGIEVMSAGAFNVTSNNIREIGEVGIALASTATAGGLAEKNRVDDTGSTGISVDGFDIRAISNRVSKTTGAGILADGIEITLEKNTVKLAGRQGIRFEGNDSLLDGNKISSSAFDGIVFSGSRNVVTNNNSTKNGGDGIDLHERNITVTNTDNEITSNKVSNNAHEGIDATGIDTVIDFNNAVKNGGAIGPQVAGAGNDVDGDGEPDGTVLSFVGNKIPVSGTLAPGDDVTGQRLDVGEQ